MLRDSRKDSFADTFEELVHVTARKGRLKRKHFVDDAAEGPHVGLVTVGLVLPHLRRGVVGSSCLRVVEPVLARDLADVHVSQLRLVKVSVVGTLLSSVPEEKDVC